MLCPLTCEGFVRGGLLCYCPIPSLNGTLFSLNGRSELIYRLVPLCYGSLSHTDSIIRVCDRTIPGIFGTILLVCQIVRLGYQGVDLYVLFGNLRFQRRRLK